MQVIQGLFIFAGLCVLATIASWQHAGEVGERERRQDAGWDQWSLHVARAIADERPEVVAQELQLAAKAVPEFVDTKKKSFEYDRLLSQVTRAEDLAVHPSVVELDRLKDNIRSTSGWIENPRGGEVPIWYFLSVVAGVFAAGFLLVAVAGIVEMFRLPASGNTEGSPS